MHFAWVEDFSWAAGSLEEKCSSKWVLCGPKACVLRELILEIGCLEIHALAEQLWTAECFLMGSLHGTWGKILRIPCRHKYPPLYWNRKQVEWEERKNGQSVCPCASSPSAFGVAMSFEGTLLRKWPWMIACFPNESSYIRQSFLKGGRGWITHHVFVTHTKYSCYLIWFFLT